MNTMSLKVSNLIKSGNRRPEMEKRLLFRGYWIDVGQRELFYARRLMLALIENESGTVVDS